MGRTLPGQPGRMADNEIHTNSSTVNDGGPEKASSEVRSDAAGKQAGPPGANEPDREAEERSREGLDRAGGGH